MGIGIYCQQGTCLISNFCHVTIGQRMPFTAAEFQENIIGSGKLCLLWADKARMRQDVNTCLNRRQVSARHHRFNQGFPMSDYYLGTQIPGPGNQIRKHGGRDMGQFNAGNQSGRRMLVQVFCCLDNSRYDKIQVR